MREVAVSETDIASGIASLPSPLRGDTFSREREKDGALPLVQLEQICKAFDTGHGSVAALDHVSLKIEANEFFTLLGPSGCGKTTLLRLIAGFEHPDSGLLRLAGKDVLGEPPNKRPVNIVFQSYALFPHMSVGRNIAFGLERQGVSPQKRESRVAEMLKLVCLEGMTNRKPSQLSGGQQQRVALARALAPGPKLLLLDEPLSALDVKLRRGMQIELKRIQRETGITFLLVTHDQEEALSMSDRIAVMDEGRIAQIGTPHEIYETPTSRFVADFMGANILPGRLLDIDAEHVAIRPEHVGFATDTSGLPGRVQETTYRGATTSCVVALDAGTTIRIEGKDVPTRAVDAPVRCIFPPEALTPLID